MSADAEGHGVAVWQDHDAARSGGHVRAIAVRRRSGPYHRVGSEFSRPTCPPS